MPPTPRRNSGVTIRAAMLAVAAAALSMTATTPLSAQPAELASESAAARERELVEQIDREQSRNGAYSASLTAPLTALGLLYEEIGDGRLAEAAIYRLLQVIRANYGLHALEQAPLIRRLIERELARGNATAAWDLEQELLALAERHREDLRTAGILRETADRRMDILRRYNAGEFPEEIVLGCYYDDVRRNPAGGPPELRCASGSRSSVRRLLAKEAQSLYAESINIIIENQDYSSGTLRELLMELVQSSYRFGNQDLGRRSLQFLLAYEAMNSESWLPRIEALVGIADWDLLYSHYLGTNTGDAALAGYEQAYELLEEHGIARDSIERLFSPEIPVVLPAFVPNPLVSTPGAGSGHIDVSFVVTRDGKSRRIEILDTSPGVTRNARKDLVETIRHSRFRPRVEDGRFSDSAPMIVRYYPAN